MTDSLSERKPVRRVLFADTSSWDSFLMLAAALRRRGVRVERLTVPRASRGQRLRGRLQRMVFHAVHPGLRSDGGGLAVDPAALARLPGPFADVQAEDTAAWTLLRTPGAPRPRRTPSPADDAALFDKTAVVAAAAAAGVPVPWTGEDPEEAALHVPAVVKTRVGAGGQGVRYAPDEAHVRKVWAELAEIGHGRPFAQEFVRGTVYSVGGVARDGRLVEAAAYRNRPAAGDCFGPSAASEVVDDAGLVGYTADLLAALGYSGMFCLDFVRDGDGHAYLIDLNARAFASWCVVQESGRDLLGAYMQVAGLEPGAARARPVQARAEEALGRAARRRRARAQGPVRTARVEAAVAALPWTGWRYLTLVLAEEAVDAVLRASPRLRAWGTDCPRTRPTEEAACDGSTPQEPAAQVPAAQVPR